MKDVFPVELPGVVFRRQLRHFMPRVRRMIHHCNRAVAQVLSSCLLLVSSSVVAMTDVPASNDKAEELKLLLEGSYQARFLPAGSVPAAFEPENLWWGANHQKYVRVIQAGCRDREAPAYDLIAHSAHWKLIGAAGAHVAQPYALILSALNAKSVSNLPKPKEFDAFIENACRALTLHDGFFNDFEYCFVDEQQVAAFAWLDGTSRERQGQQNTTLIRSLRPSRVRVCENWMKTAGHLSGAYVASTNFQAEQVEIATNKAEQERRHEQEARRARDQNAERARQEQNALAARIAAEMERAFREGEIAARDQIIWKRAGYGAPNNRATTGRRFPDSSALFSELNAELERQHAQISGGVSFTPPKKGEFETTAAYKARTDALMAEHAKEGARQRTIAGEQWPVTRARIFHEYLGEPVIEQLTYDADKEIFSARIKTTSAPYHVDAILSVPLTSAPTVKPELEGAAIQLGFALVNGLLEPKVLLLHSTSELWVASTLRSTKVPIRFGAESARAYAASEATKDALAVAERGQSQAGRVIRYEHTIAGAPTAGDSPRAILARIWGEFIANPRNTNRNSRQINVRGTLIKKGTVPPAALNSSAHGRLPSYLACYQFVQISVGMGDYETELCIYYTSSPSRGTNAIGWRGPEYIQELEAQMVADQFRPD